MLSIQSKDMDGCVYVGPEPRLEDVVVVPAHIRRIVFPFGLNVKGLMTGNGVDVICRDASRIRHAQMGGNALFEKSLFCGALDISGTILVKGDLISWMGDLVSREGNVIANGEIRSAGTVQAKNGVIVSDTGIHAESKIFSLNTWHPKLSEPKDGLAAIAIRQAEFIFKS